MELFEQVGANAKVADELIHVETRATFQQDMFNGENEQLTECRKHVMFHLVTRKALPVIKIISAQMASKWNHKKMLGLCSRHLIILKRSCVFRVLVLSRIKGNSK